MWTPAMEEPGEEQLGVDIVDAEDGRAIKGEFAPSLLKGVAAVVLAAAFVASQHGPWLRIASFYRNGEIALFLRRVPITFPPLHTLPMHWTYCGMPRYSRAITSAHCKQHTIPPVHTA